MKKGIKHRFITFAVLMTLILLCTLLYTYWCVTKIQKEKTSNLAVNSARTHTNAIMSYISKNYDNISSPGEKSTIRAMLKEINSNLELVDSYGKILFNSKDPSLENRTTDISSSLQYDTSFMEDNPGLLRITFPMVVGGHQVGNAIFDLPENILKESNFHQSPILTLSPILLSAIFEIILLLLLFAVIKREVLQPIEALNRSADKIARGNLQEKIKYNYDTEIGKFGYTFDMMREELKNSLEKQRDLEQNRKELIACISHDLRTPIASIKAYVEGLQDGIAKDEETTARYLSVINKKTQSLTRLIDDLFEHSQCELSKLVINKKEQYSKEIFTKILEPVKLDFKNSPLDFVIQGEIPNVLVNADNKRIEQVIVNLINNARKYTKEGGKIYLKAELEGNFLKVNISDTGYGISPSELPFIFDKFYRGEQFKNRDYEGAGLGLSICKEIVEAHGGEIKVESILDKGSSFYFTIPKL